MTKNKYFAYFKIMFIFGVVNSVTIGFTTLMMILNAIIVAPGFFLFVIILGGMLAVLIIGTKKFHNFSKMTEEQLLTQRGSLSLWSVMFSIFLFPMGMLSLIPLFNLNEEYPMQAYVPQTPTTYYNEPRKDTMDEKMEKIQKFHEMKEKGILSLEDFLAIKERILKE